MTPRRTDCAVQDVDTQALDVAAAVVHLYRSHALGDPRGLERAERALAELGVKVTLREQRPQPEARS